MYVERHEAMKAPAKKTEERREPDKKGSGRKGFA